MILDLKKILARGLRIDRGVELPALENDQGAPLVPGEVRVLAEARKGSRGGVELRGSWEAEVVQGCSRCLEPFATPLAESFFLRLVDAEEDAEEGERAMDPEDVALFPVEDGQVELAVVLSELVQLALPLKPLCEPGCRGLCSTCGENRNRIECSCRQEQVDPRLDVLRRLRDSLED